MPLTFSGTYTKNDGDEAAAGTVTVTHDDGTTGTATLDTDGAYTLELDTSGGTVTIVETLDGAPAHTFETGVTEGAAIDTSRDLGRVGLTQSGASVDWAAVETPAIYLKATDAEGAGAVLEGGFAAVQSIDANGLASLNANADGGQVAVQANGANGVVNISASGAGGQVVVTLRSPDGSAYVLEVADDGTLSTSPAG